jgi:hypothetical protein
MLTVLILIFPLSGICDKERQILRCIDPSPSFFKSRVMFCAVIFSPEKTVEEQSRHTMKRVNVMHLDDEYLQKGGLKRA